MPRCALLPLLLLLAALAGSAALPSDAAACSCAMADEQALRAQADVVFTGRVTGIEDPNAGDVIMSSADPLLAGFQVLSVRKGRPARGTFVAWSCGGSVRLRSSAAPAARGRRRARVVTARSGASCGLGLRVGEVWRIYAQRARPADIPPPRPSSVAGALLG